MKKLLAIALLYASTATAQQFGIDTLAGAKYPNIVRTIPNHLAVGFFAETFGDAFPIVRKELEAGRSKVRVHFIWSDTHTFGDRDIPKVQALARRYAPLCATGRLELSPFCEHNVAQPDKYLDIVAKLAPGCAVVNTPWRGGISRKYKNEVHGDHSVPAGQYNYSFDGTNSVDAQLHDINTVGRDGKPKVIPGYFSKHLRADTFFLWHPRLNLKWSMKDTTPRPKRNAKPTAEFMDSLEYLFTDPGAVSLPKGWLLKSHADHHGGADPKGDKLIVISPIRASKVELKRGNRLVATLPFYGPFDGGGYRYYSRIMGFKYGPGLEVWVNGKRYGVVNGGFRAGTFR